MEPDSRDCAEHEKEQQCKALRDQEWRLVAIRRQRMQKRPLEERLRDQGHDVKPERRDGGGDLHPAPNPSQTLAKAREQRDRQYYK